MTRCSSFIIIYKEPVIAIIDSNTLSCIGLKSLLDSIMPGVPIDVYGTFSELQANHPERYFHYFVSMNIVLTHLDFFTQNCRKTIVMTTSADPESTLSRFHCLCVGVSEKELIKSLLRLEQFAHHGGKSLPMPQTAQRETKVLSDREIEVLTLIVRGYINKEIASRLHVSLSTIITHRRNIQEKLSRKSVGALTIYAVIHGYVGINEL